MLKVFRWTTVLTTLSLQVMVEVAFSKPLTLDSRYPYPLVNNSMPSTPICYIETADGEVINLSNLCTTQDKTNLAKPPKIAQLLKTKNCPKCNLSGAKLRSAELMTANLQNANLSKADLRGAKLNGARLINADLRGANLVGANLLGANLFGAKLQGANLRRATMPDGTIHK